MTSPFLENVSFWLEPVFLFIDFPPVLFSLEIFDTYFCNCFPYTKRQTWTRSYLIHCVHMQILNLFLPFRIFLKPKYGFSCSKYGFSWYKLFHIQKSNQNYCDKYFNKVTWYFLLRIYLVICLVPIALPSV